MPAAGVDGALQPDPSGDCDAAVPDNPGAGQPQPDPAPEEGELIAPSSLRAEATSLQHLMTRAPANRYCPICRHSKPIRAPHRRGAMAHSDDQPKKDRGAMTADYVVLKSGSSFGAGGEKAMLVMLYVATDWVTVHPTPGGDSDPGVPSANVAWRTTEIRL